MIAEIIATGEEIRTGALVDTNSAYIAQALEGVGAEVVRFSALGDDFERLRALLEEVGPRADVCVLTGGLGPTVDDLTSAAAAAAAGVPLYLDPRAISSIEEFFHRRGRPLNPTIRKQALLPQGAEVLYNPVGTAPGFSLKIARCLFFFLPGVPFEMQRMLADHVLPRVLNAFGDLRGYRLVRTLKCFGLTESLTGERLGELEQECPGVRLGLRARFPEIQVKLYASGTDQASVSQRLDRASAWVRQQLGDIVFSDSDEPMEAVVGCLLRQRNATLAVAESCTGGLISHLLTEVPGSSDYFRIGVVAYANAAKTAALGVSVETLSRGGAVHEETAAEMACGARRLAGATYGLATTGIAGPAGGSEQKPVGTVCIGLSSAEKTEGFRFRYSYERRTMNKQIFAMKALDILRRELLGLPSMR